MGKWSQLKVVIILCVLFFFSWKGEILADCDILVEEGKTCLKNLDFVCANSKFEAALGECPDHYVNSDRIH